MRFHAGGVLTHIDHLGRRPSSLITDGSANGPGSSRINFKVHGRGLALQDVWLLGVDFSRATCKQRGRATEMEEVNGSHIWLLPFFPRRSDVLGHVAGKRLEELDQICAILSG